MTAAINYLRSLFTLPPRRPDWPDAVVAGIVFAVSMLAGTFLIKAEYVPFAAMMSVFIFIMAPKVSWFGRRLASIAFSIAAAAVVTAIAAFASPWAWTSALVMAGICFVVTLAAAFGPGGTMLAALLPQVAIILLATPAYYPDQIVNKTIIALVAGCWGAVVFVVAVFARNQFTARDAMVQMYGSLAQFALSPNSFNQAESLAAIEAVTRMTSPPLFSTAHTTVQLEHAHRLSTMATWLHRAVLQANQRGEQLSPEVIGWIKSVGGAIHAGQRVPAPTTAVAQVVGPIPWDEIHPARPVRLGTRLRASVSLDSVVMRHAVRYAAAVLTAALIAELTGVREGWWIVLTVVVVLRAGMAQSLSTISSRLAGTLIGALAGSILISIITTEYVEVVVIAALLLIVAVAVLPLNYTYGTICITTLVLLLVHSAGGAGFELVGWRVLNTVIGAVIAAAAAMLLWPDRGSNAVPRQLRQYLDVVTDLAIQTRGKIEAAVVPAATSLYWQALIAESDARTAIAAWSGEPGSTPESATASSAVVDAITQCRDQVIAGTDLRQANQVNSELKSIDYSIDQLAT